jgi:hypothetical protein
MGLFPERFPKSPRPGCAPLEEISVKQFNVPSAETVVCGDDHRANFPAANSSRSFSLAISALSLHARL